MISLEHDEVILDSLEQYAKAWFDYLLDQGYSSIDAIIILKDIQSQSGISPIDPEFYHWLAN